MPCFCWHHLYMLQEFHPPSGALEQAIDAQFGALDGMISKFNAATAAVQARTWQGVSAWGQPCMHQGSAGGTAGPGFLGRAAWGRNSLPVPAHCLQGSGWGWLAYHPEAKTLVITTTPNQDPLQPTTGLVPLLGVDVWCAGGREEADRQLACSANHP